MTDFKLPQVIFSKVFRAVVEFELIDDGGRFKSGGTAVALQRHDYRKSSPRLNFSEAL